MDARELLSVGEVAARSGFAASALRFYEAEGLIDATRTSGGRRQFQRSVLRRLAFIRAASNIGLTLDEVRVELDRLPAEGCRRKPTGSGSRAIGGGGSTPRSEPWSGCETVSTPASVVAVSRSSAAR